MNKVFSTYWCESRQEWIVASELASGGGRQKLTPKKSALTLLLGTILLQPGSAMAVDYIDETLTNITQNLNAGDTATSTTVNSGGVQNVSSGGSATSTTVNSGGYQNINSGGSATATTVNSRGWQGVNSGGSATSTTVNSGGTQYVSGGGSATASTVNGGGVQFVSGVDMSIIINTGGQQIINEGGLAVSATVSSGGEQKINKGGIATSSLVLSGGLQTVNILGSASDVTVGFGGVQDVYRDGSATLTTLNGGFQNVSSGGSATATTVNSGGIQNVSSGGSATATTVNAGGYQFVSSGGSVTSTMVNSEGYQFVESGGSATATTVNSGGVQNVSSDGSATSTTVKSGGTLVVDSGGNSLDVIQNSGGALVTNTSANVSGTNALGTFFINGVTGSAGNVLLENGGKLDVLGSATSTTVNSGGVQNVSSGGSATATTVNSGGIQNVSSGGSATVTTVNAGGWQYVSSGGSATATTVNSGGIQNVSSGGSATATTVNSGGFQNVSSGGSATATTVNSGGIQNVSSGGSATATTVNAGGYQFVSSGGSATATTVNSGGVQNVSSDGSATSTTVKSGGTLVVDSGGNSLDVIQNSGGALVTNTSANVSGTNALGTFFINGVTGSAGNVLLENGGKLDVLVNGIASDTTVRENGLLTVASGGQLSGHTIIENGGKLSGSDVINNGNLHYLQNVSAVYQGHLTGAGRLTQDGGNLIIEGILRQEGGIFLNSGGVLTLNDLLAVADITAESGTQLRLTGSTILTGKVDPTNMDVNSGSTWNMTGDSQLDSLINSGNINFVHGSGAFTPMILTTTNFTGSGGTITLHSVLGDASSPVDKIVIDGGKATGNTNLLVVNDGGLGAGTAGKGIEVVSTINGGTTEAGAFNMKSPVDAGAYRYSLYRNTNGNWYLTTGSPDDGSGGTSTPRYSNAAWLYQALPVLAMDYERQVLGDRDSRRTVVATDQETGRDLWGRMRTGYLRHDKDESMSESDSHYAFIQMGGDIWAAESHNAVWRAGVYGAAGSNQGDVQSGDDGRRGGNMRDSIYTGGLYLSGMYQNGFYLDNIFQVSQHDITTTTEQKSMQSVSGTGVAISAEGGWVLPVTRGLFVEPQIQYVWQTLRLDDATDSTGTTFRPGNSQLHQFRAGMRIGNAAREGEAGGKYPVSFWIKPSVIQTVGSHSDTTVGMKGLQGSEVTFRPDQDGTVLSAEVGAEMVVGTRGSLGLRGGYAGSVQGGAAGGYYGQMNIKIRF